MCLGIPAQLVAGETGHPDLVMAEVGGVPRTVNVGLLDERPGPGDWILVHMGFALNGHDGAGGRRRAGRAGRRARAAEDREAAAWQAAMDAAARPRRKPSPHGGCRDRGGTGPGRRAHVRQVRLPAERPGLLRSRRGFRDYAEAGVVDQGLVQLVQAFSGAWPYLELISAGCDIGDPLDQRVVEAYWVGNELLDRVLDRQARRLDGGAVPQAAGEQVPVPGRGSAGGRGAAP